MFAGLRQARSTPNATFEKMAVERPSIRSRIVVVTAALVSSFELWAELKGD